MYTLLLVSARDQNIIRKIVFKNTENKMVCPNP